MKKIPLIIIILLFTALLLPGVALAVSYHIVLEKGNDQVVQVGKKAPEKLVVRVVDSRGNPINTTVSFKVVKGEGKLEKKNVNTDRTGRAKTVFKAGYTPGKTKVRAYLKKYNNVSADFNLKVTLDNPRKKDVPTKSIEVSPAKTPSPRVPRPSPTAAPTTTPVSPQPTPQKTPETEIEPAVIIGFGGNNQQVSPGQFAGKNLEVQVLDENGTPVQGVRVQFEVVEGIAFVQPTSNVTDADGIAFTALKAGNYEGDITIKAFVVGGNDLATIFNLESTEDAPIVVDVPGRQARTRPSPTPRATGTTQPTTQPRPKGYYSREPVNISVAGGNYQSAEPGARLTQPLVVFVSDADGNPVEATVQFTVLGGDARIVNRQVKTNDQGLASTFVVVNSLAPVKIVAEVLEKPGLSTIAYANTKRPATGGDSSYPMIRATRTTDRPGYPSAIAFYSLKSQNVENIEKTRVIPLEIGVIDFRKQPVSTPIRFTAIKGNVSILNPVVQTNEQGRGICYVDIGNSMGIFSIEAQSLENPDLKAVFKSGPQIKPGPAQKVVRPGLERSGSKDTSSSPTVSAKPPVETSRGKPALIAVLKGAGQKGKIGRKLPKPIEVLITDTRGNPVSGVMVSFVVSRGKAKIERPFARTDKNGKVSTRVTLGNQPGIVEIAIRVRDNKSLRTTVQVTAQK